MIGTFLQGADMQGSLLQGADLTDAYLRDALLQGADMRGTILQDAVLLDANLQGARLPQFQIVLDVGAFIGFKKLGNGTIATLEIPADAKRTSSLVGRKCRAEFVRVIDGYGTSSYCTSVRYEPGAIVRADEWDDDPRVECTHGIHFFITRQEAVEYY